MSGMERRLRELERRVLRLVQVGTVVDADYPGRRVLVQVGERESQWLRWTVHRAGADRSWWPPRIGEQVLVLAPNGEVLAAVVGDSLYQQDYDAPADDPEIRRTSYGNGTVVELDKNSNLLKVTHPGDVQVQAEGSVSMSAGGDISIVAAGDVTIQGATVRLN